MQRTMWGRRLAMRTATVVSAVILLGSWTARANAQTRRITGRVVDATDHTPIPAATVSVTGHDDRHRDER